jgi:uncharacterized protein YjbI with pentapeptide repeats
MFTRLTALTVAATMLASSASAFDSKILKMLKNLSITKIESIVLGRGDGTLEERNERFERRRLAHEDWENYPKDKIDLSSADLSEVYLEDIILSAANLSGTDLSGSILRGADLSVADLSGANLSRTGLSGANLYGADLRGADLSGALLDEANLERAIMNGAILCNTTMPDGSVIYSGC